MSTDPRFDLVTEDQIGEIIGGLDDKIELNRQINQTLEQIAQAIFKSWFVDFDPVKAKIAAKQNGLDIERAAMCAINGKTDEELDQLSPDQCQQLAATAALFPDELVDSELGEIPKGWDVRKLDSVTRSIFSGGTPRTNLKEFWDGEHFWFSSGETRNKYVTKTEKTITQVGIDSSSTRLANYGDILIASAGQGNTRGQVSFCACDTYINQSVVSIRADSEKCAPLWLFHNLRGRYQEMRMISDSHSIRGSLTTKLLGSMKIILPSLPVVNIFSEVIETLAKKEIQNIKDNDVLSGIRDSLLPKLLSGEFTLSDDQSKPVAVA